MYKTKTTLIILSFLFSFLVSTSQKSTTPVDARWVISQSIQAMGGEDLLRSIKTLYTEMSTEMDGRSVTWITKEMLPNKGAFQIVYQGRVVFETWFNGKNGFVMSNGQTKESDPKSLADKYPRKNIFNELDYLDTSIYKIEILQDTKVGKTDCYKVRAVFVTGDERHLYIDKKRFHTVKEDRIKNGENDVSETAYFDDFKKYGDLVFYSKLRMGDGKVAQKAKTTKLIINGEITEGDFNKQ